MRKKDGVLMRQLAAAIILSALAIAAIAGAIGPAAAADLSPGLYPVPARSGAYACPPKEEAVILFDEEGKPTVPARTPYFTCVTNTVLLPGEIPPPPEYCCH